MNRTNTSHFLQWHPVLTGVHCSLLAKQLHVCKSCRHRDTQFECNDRWSRNSTSFIARVRTPRKSSSILSGGSEANTDASIRWCWLIVRTKIGVYVIHNFEYHVCHLSHHLHLRCQSGPPNQPSHLILTLRRGKAIAITTHAKSLFL